MAVPEIRRNLILASYYWQHLVQEKHDHITPYYVQLYSKYLLEPASIQLSSELYATCAAIALYPQLSSLRTPTV
ncbi:hypothetical protein OROMI_025926 [Orobanche minor]